MKLIVFVLCLSLNLYSFSFAGTSKESHIVYDISSHTVIQSNNSTELSSIASLSKLMTAIICVDTGKCNINLLKRLLIRSDNSAAEEIAKSYPGGRYNFISQMNRRAAQLGLQNTHFHDPSGLSIFNVSTSREYVNVLMEAEKYSIIKRISSTQQFREKKNYLYNTNLDMLEKNENISLSKTGFTQSAGFCLALIVENVYNKYAIIILGEKSKVDRTKIAEQLMARL